MIIGPQAGLSELAGPTALVAAAATVIGAITVWIGIAAIAFEALDT